MGWLFWYLFIGVCIGAYGKATQGTSSGVLYSEIIALLLFTLFWPVVIAWVIHDLFT